MNEPMVRAVTGMALAGAIAIGARHTRALNASGMWAAWIVGTICVTAGWSWGTLLIAFFLTSTALSHVGATQKQATTAAIVAKGGARDAIQVLANGGFFALCALGALLLPSPPLIARALGAGALATSCADTWATEIGTLIGRTPRSIVSLQRVAHGTSGGITVAGTMATLCGAAFIAVLVLLFGWSLAVAAGALIGGIAGALIDSVIGATLQARRHCPQCHTLTERLIHRCGVPTTPAGGLPWLDNDAVNMVSAIVGAGLALASTGAFHGR